MMNRKVMLIVFCCAGYGMAQAAEQGEVLQVCHQMTGAEMLHSKPECFALLQQEADAQKKPPQTAAQPSANAPLQAATTPPQPADSAPEFAAELPPPEEVGNLLEAQWPQPMQARRVSSYRQNYLIVTHSSQPNNAPTSPNPDNVVPPTYPYSPSEVKFQLSIKARISELFGGMLWLGYTQQSWWQLFDADHSRPFRESNYEPELIYSYQLSKESGLKWLPDILNLALNHQSNGQALPRSRSWNRIYVQAGWEDDNVFGNTLVVMPRIWRRLATDGPGQDDNPDIMRYLGYGDLDLRYLVRRSDNKKVVFESTLRQHSVQFDLSVPMPGSSDISFHFQHFRGYGESLIDYNQKHFTTGVGFSAYF